MDSTSALGYEPYFNTAYYIGTTMNYSVIRHENEFFWSKNATYCSSDDATCTGCRAKWIDAFQNQYQISDFSCVGTGGCVCTAYCELRQLTAFPAYNYSSGSETCYDRSGVVAWSNADQGSLMLVRNIATLLIGALMVVMTVRQIMIQFHQRTWLVLMLTVYYIVCRCVANLVLYSISSIGQHERRMREQRAALRRQRDETSRFGLMLTLEGWNGYREQLIEREQETLGLKSEPLLSEAPTRAVVAEGEGFRPATPSQLTRQQRTTREG